ncbi:pyruvate dehydrogenase complex dihydrolipoamide acetyltransferase [Castellaniella caeni]|uniref:pyruvate dehydrogenase complex dihydrolipoamide acetyltransferase n=1 Tax=Castellaniella caeni TaxID=266123 RepID=UPI00083155EC|nr:pyruvate dehydrogenase complex dihydrolipoamide acetyltransferase [Castellaniella caeni]
MAVLLQMPEVAANMESATIVAWSKAEGDPVAVGDCLAEIETDKAVIEFNAESDGVLGKILVSAGQAAAVAAPIAVLLSPGETDADAAALMGQVRDAAAAQVAAPPSAQAAGAGVSPAAGAAASVSAASLADAQQGRVFASPLARRLAADAGLALQGLPGSGPHGRIVRRDVQAALQQPRAPVATAAAGAATAGAAAQVAGTAAASATAADQPGVTRIPHTAMRRTIARRLLESKTTVPHFYLRADCRMDELLALRQRINASVAQRISVNDLIVKAAAVALAELPQMNVSWTDDALLQYDAVDVSVAVATESGLITPIVRQADQKALSAISTDIADLAARAREGRLQPHEYQGGSFTVSNLGMHGVTEFAAIINPPQAAILAVGATEKRAIVDSEEQVFVASMMTVTLSVDHRAIDGALAARWLKVFKRLIEAPMSILI